MPYVLNGWLHFNPSHNGLQIANGFSLNPVNNILPWDDAIEFVKWILAEADKAGHPDKTIPFDTYKPYTTNEVHRIRERLKTVDPLFKNTKTFLACMPDKNTSGSLLLFQVAQLRAEGFFVERAGDAGLWVSL